MRLIVLATAAILSLAATPARADGPSFNCDKAGAPAEHLICADGELIRLDALLGETYSKRRSATPEAQRKALLDQQREWLKSRLLRCGITSQGGEPDEQQKWAWAACLADRYRERLAVLGVTDPAAREPTASGYIHPLCLQRAIGSVVGDNDAKPTPRQACNNAHRHIPVEAFEGDGWSAMGGGVDRESISYRRVGTLADGAEVIQVHFWGGGTGQFSGIYKLNRKGDTLIGSPLAGGGDRCNGGITETQVLRGDVVRVTHMATAADLFGALLPESSTGSDALPACAICCYATTTVDYPPGQPGQLVSVTIDGENDTPDDEPALRCLNRVFGMVKGKSRTLTATEARTTARRYIKECVK